MKENTKPQRNKAPGLPDGGIGTGKGKNYCCTVAEMKQGYGKKAMPKSAPNKIPTDRTY